MTPRPGADPARSSRGVGDWFLIALRYLLVVLSARALIIYLYVALSRVSYPFAVEWVEPNVSLHVERVMEGEPLYVEPGYEFIPMIYTPLYYYLSAAVASVTHQIMLSMRLVSIVSSLALFAMLYLLSRTHQLSRSSSFLAVGLFAAAYGLTGYWLDIGKPDTLFLALLLAAYLLVVVRLRHEKVTGLIAGFLLCLSFAAKQQAAGAFPFLLLYLLIDRRWAKALSFGAGFSVTAGGFIALSSAASQGWFWFYTFTVPSSLPILTSPLLEFWKTLALQRYFWLLVPIALSLLVGWRGKAWPWLKGLLLLLPLFGISLLSVAKLYGYVNGLLPSAAALALLGAWAAHHVNVFRPRNALLQTAAVSLTCACLGAQFFSLSYNPAPQIPTKANLQAGYHTLEVLREAEAPIFVPTWPDLLSLAGKPTHFHGSSLGDLNAAAKHNPTVNKVCEE